MADPWSEIFGQQTPAAGTPRPGTPWEQVFGMPGTDQTVYINPVTKVVVQTNDPVQIAKLETSGFVRHIVKPENWAALEAVARIERPIPNTDWTIPVTPNAPLTPEEIAAQQRVSAGIDAQAGAQAENLNKAYELTQPARDRAALQTKEQYGAAIMPTLAAGAFAGAGYHQPLKDIFDKGVQRDRGLADLNDQNLSEQFRLQQAQQALESQRLAAQQEALNRAVAGSTQRYGNNVDNLLAWLK